MAATVAAAYAVAAYAAPGASAAPATIEAGTGGANVFSAPAYVHQAGTLAQMVWVGGGPHNVTAGGIGPDGNPLFASATISGGSTPVNGSQYAEAGSYPFLCTIHPATMTGTLNVAGTPLPRPAVSLKIKSRRLAQVVKKRAVKVKTTIDGGQGEAAEVNVKLGKKTIGIAKSTTSTGVLKIKLTRKGQRRLENRGKAKLRAEATIDFGSPASAKRVLK